VSLKKITEYVHDTKIQNMVHTVIFTRSQVVEFLPPH
jgi:hypothetical protein